MEDPSRLVGVTRGSGYVLSSPLLLLYLTSEPAAFRSYADGYLDTWWSIHSILLFFSYADIPRVPGPCTFLITLCELLEFYHFYLLNSSLYLVPRYVCAICLYITFPS